MKVQPKMSLPLQLDLHWRQINHTAKSKCDHLGSIIGAQGAELQAIRSSKALNGLNVEVENPQAIDPNLHASFKASQSTFASKMVAKQGFVSAAIKIYKLCQDFWSSLQKALTERGYEFNASDLAGLKTKAGLLLEELNTNVPYLRARFEGTQLQREIEVHKIPGSPVAEGAKYSEKHLLQRSKSASMREFIKSIETRISNVCNKILLIGIYQDDPLQTEYLMVPDYSYYEDLQQDPVHCYAGVIYYNLLASPDKIGAASLAFQRQLKYLKPFYEAESATINTVMQKITEWLEVKRNLATQPASQPQKQVLGYAVPYTMSNAVKKSKSKKVVSTAMPEEKAPVAAPTPAPQKIKPSVILHDPDAYATFLTLMGNNTNKISWNDVVYCLPKLGFEVTPAANGNTWKFKWEAQSWLREAKSLDEIADEAYAEEEATSATSSFHVPHHNGLTKRGPLDHGRLSSFKKLLTEAGFDQECVTFIAKNEETL